MNKMNYKGFCTSVAEKKWMNYKHISYYIVLKVRNTRYCADFSFIENIKPLVTKLLKQLAAPHYMGNINKKTYLQQNPDVLV